MNWFQMAYTVAGGLGIFLYGMMYLSSGLQTIGGRLIRKAVGSLTNNRVIGVLVGTIITMFVQSSSITTVMVVGFVNAGLMSLSQSIGVIMGANIGTTITGWIISFKVGKYAWALIGLGALPMLMSRRDQVQSYAKVLFSLGLIFLGLQTMSGAFKPLRTDADFISLLQYFDAKSFISLYGTIFMGCVLTIMVQSSSAMLGITIALASTGAISFQTAVALVLGENIGTTITALLAGIGANTAARRTACAHAVFNLFGVGVMSLFFWKYVDILEHLIPNNADFFDASGSKPFIAQHIAVGHTLFNVTNVILFLPFTGHLARFVSAIVPERKAKQPKHLEFLGSSTTMSAELALQQGRMELMKVGDMIQNMIQWTRDYTLDPDGNQKKSQKILRYEEITDNIQHEMTSFMSHVLGSELSKREVQEAQAQITIIDELESIADYCQKTLRHVNRLDEQNEKFDEITYARIDALLDNTQSYFDSVLSSLKNPSLQLSEQRKKLREDFEASAQDVRETYASKIVLKESSALASMTVADLILCMQRIVSHSRTIARTLQSGESRV
jgi:phosphate:Na+ symporter